MKERVFLRRVVDDSGTLLGDGAGILADPDADMEEFVRSAGPSTVAIRVRNLDFDKDEQEKIFYVWIDGEILPGDELQRRRGDTQGSPASPEKVVIARTGTIFSAGEHDRVVSSKSTSLKIYS